MNIRTPTLNRDLPSQQFSSPQSPRATDDCPGDTAGSEGGNPNECPFDLESLLHRCLGDRTFCALMLKKFSDRAAHQLAALDRAANARNTVELTREAHTLKGVAANISAEALRTCAARLEQAARAGQLDKAGVLVQQVHAQVDRCLQAMPLVLAQVDAGA
jgi:HPt (histidine-containing phosphotransfer) domain-containing protein